MAIFYKLFMGVLLLLSTFIFVFCFFLLYQNLPFFSQWYNERHRRASASAQTRAANVQLLFAQGEVLKEEALFNKDMFFNAACGSWCVKRAAWSVVDS